MKNKKTKDEPAAQARKKVQVNSLKLQKETVEDLSDQVAENVKGGMLTKGAATCKCGAVG